jgi:hypothetical protein
MQPLRGVTVVALEHAIAAPFATRQLADLGARVIKIERPGSGDFARAYDDRVRGLASHFVWTNCSKESLTLDLKQPAAHRILERLVLEQADVLVQNLAPGAAARMGLSFEALAPRKPGLIVCDISGYGADGPYRDKKAYDLLIQSEAGLLSVTGTPEVPGKAGASMSRCWRRWPSGWASRCATASMAHPRRNAPVPATPRSTPTARSGPGTASRSCWVCRMSGSGTCSASRCCSSRRWHRMPDSRPMRFAARGARSWAR